MDKKEIAQKINHTADLGRVVKTNYQLDLAEGQIYDNRGKCESWSDRDLCTEAFISETDGEYTYIFYCDQVPCHKVDYANKQECDVLGSCDCASEAEVLVLDTAVMRIVDVGNDDDFEEIGYYPVRLKFEGSR